MHFYELLKGNRHKIALEEVKKIIQLQLHKKK